MYFFNSLIWLPAQSRGMPVLADWKILPEKTFKEKAPAAFPWQNTLLVYLKIQTLAF